MHRRGKWRTVGEGISVLIVVGIFYVSTAYGTEAQLIATTTEHRLLGAVLLALVMCATTVFAPLTSLPLIPVIAPILGPFTTGTACYVGWTVGAICAFWIGRRYGQAFILRYVKRESLVRYEQCIRPDIGFILIVALRMLVPVDVVSYALAILSTISFKKYIAATMLGILWFSYAFAYGGIALMEHNYVLLSYIGVASVVILCSAWWYARHTLRKER